MKVCSYIVLGRLLVGFLQNGRYLSPYERPDSNASRRLFVLSSRYITLYKHKQRTDENTDCKRHNWRRAGQRTLSDVNDHKIIGEPIVQTFRYLSQAYPPPAMAMRKVIFGISRPRLIVALLKFCLTFTVSDRSVF